jgi:hypothetical protein
MRAICCCCAHCCSACWQHHAACVLGQPHTVPQSSGARFSVIRGSHRALCLVLCRFIQQLRAPSASEQQGCSGRDGQRKEVVGLHEAGYTQVRHWNVTRTSSSSSTAQSRQQAQAQQARSVDSQTMGVQEPSTPAHTHTHTHTHTHIAHTHTGRCSRHAPWRIPAGCLPSSQCSGLHL